MAGHSDQDRCLSAKLRVAWSFPEASAIGLPGTVVSAGNRGALNSGLPKLVWLAWGGLAAMLALILGGFLWSRAGASSEPMPVIGLLKEFNLTNQNNEAVTLNSLRGKVWIADVIFTRCPGPCTKMSGVMAKLQSSLRAEDSVGLVSLTSDPEYDTPARLKAYASNFDADARRWWLLTGARRQIRELEVNDFKFVVVEKRPADRQIPDDLFIHSTSFMLVDRQGRLRGWKDGEGHIRAKFDLEDPDTPAEMRAAIQRLLKEPIS